MDAQLPLNDVRIVDATQVGAGPYMTTLLGDLGADVIKIEPPGGEPMRTVDNHFAYKESAYYFGINRSKRDITLNLKSEQGQKVVHRMLESADVFAISMRPEAVRKLGLDYETLKDRYPRLVYCCVTAFGEDGPRAKAPGMDIVAQALSGIMALTGYPDLPPVKAGPPIADWSTSFFGALGIVAALRTRDRDGVGQKVSVNLLDSAIACLPNFVTPALITGTRIRRSGSGHPQVVPYQVFETSDGHIVVACLSDQFWAPLCTALERPDLVHDERFYTNPERVKNRDVLVPMIAEILKTRDKAAWIERFTAEDFPHAPVNELEEVFVDPQVVHNGMILDLDHPRYGPYSVVNNPIKMSRTPPAPFGYSPSPGEHSQEILAELGFSEEDIRSIIEEGAGGGV